MINLNSENLPLRSVHTSNFPNLLSQLGISLVVSTYQAGKLIVLRADGNVINTHFRVFDKPMGMAIKGGKLALGTTYRIWELHNVPAVTGKLEPPHKHDACYLPRTTHVTGDIDIHEMAYVQDSLWFINTRFSCLCTLDSNFSFVPQWRPPFISSYDLSDRCHLNGLGTRDEQVRYITALGETDSPNGWRKNKARGGIVMDITTNEIIVRGLSMPHSPRWYAEQLWVLESGNGSLARVNPSTGEITTVAQVPGFTRGIDFYGSLAFIGLSQVRETAVFSGIPITERLTERICGVWVVNIYTGEIIAFLKFEDAVQEIFAVTVLPGMRFPEIIDWDEKLLGSSYILPDAALKDVALPEASPSEKFVINSFSIVVPVFNIEKKGSEILLRTLRSIEASIEFFINNYPDAERINYDVALVDDASTDKTWEILNQFASDKPYYRLIQHPKNRGQGAARNTGVNSTKGQVIFFCDDDDLYLPNHILTCLTGLTQPLTNENRSQAALSHNYPGAVKTGVKLKDWVNPDWKEIITNALVLNYCVRREAHEFIVGFPEDEVFRKSIYALEDYSYYECLSAFFNVKRLPSETVEHIRYPGNHFDWQLPKFQKAPGEYKENIFAEQQEYLNEIESLVLTKKESLQTKFKNALEAERLLALGDEAYGQRNLLQAAEYYQQSLVLNPNLKVARHNLGAVYLDLERWQEAIRELQQVLDADPNYADAHNNLGVICQSHLQMKEAISHYRKAIAIRHEFPEAHFNLSMALLQSGDLREGFAKYQWRWQTKHFIPFNSPNMKWDGRSLPGKTILIHTEQGVGDAIQFIRYLPLVAKRCQRTILFCSLDVVRLFSTVEGISEIRTPGDIKADEFDAWVPLMSLPDIFETTLDTIPCSIPYLQVLPNPELDSLFSSDTQDSLLRVGIVWKGSSTHRNDRHRSSSLNDFLPILHTPGVAFYSLQKERQPEDVVQLKDLNVRDLSPYLGNFADTACAISHLDLVIGVDTSVIHVAGALGKPVWTLLCYSPDWRWLLERADTPWYPTMRLFRQSQPDYWYGVFQEVAQAWRHLREESQG